MFSDTTYQGHDSEEPSTHGRLPYGQKKTLLIRQKSFEYALNVILQYCQAGI